MNLPEYYDELGTPQGRWWHVDDSTIWTMIDWGCESILWVSQVILRKSIPLSPLRCDCWHSKLQEKKWAKDVEDTLGILVIFMLSADSVWTNLAKSFCIHAKECLRQPLNNSRHQNPTRYPNDHSRNCLPLWHLSSRDASKIQTLPNLSKCWQTLAVWKYLCGSKVAPKKNRPPKEVLEIHFIMRCGVDSIHRQQKVSLAPQTTDQSMSFKSLNKHQ